MPRHARFRLAGVPWHVVQRGNNRNPCFWDERDRVLYLGLLEELAPLFGCQVHAYVLMTNHVHLLVSPNEETGVSQLMKNLGQRYVQFVNRTRLRTGSLWEGRFRSSFVDTEGYLLRCQRYIELNPVRAGMVDTPSQYEWSSFRANAWGMASSIVTPHPAYLQLASDNGERLEAYAAWVGEGTTPEELQAIRQALNGGFAWGSVDFIERLARDLGLHPARKRQPNMLGSACAKAD